MLLVDICGRFRVGKKELRAWICAEYVVRFPTIYGETPECKKPWNENELEKIFEGNITAEVNRLRKEAKDRQPFGEAHFTGVANGTYNHLRAFMYKPRTAVPPQYQNMSD